MAEGTAQSSRYVKLKKDHAPLEDITPGELNQPVEVPQVRSLRFLNCTMRFRFSESTCS